MDQVNPEQADGTPSRSFVIGQAEVVARPLQPALYLVANAGIALAMLTGRPLECAIALLVTASGLPFRAAFSRRRSSARAR